jgi:hypothetical protein
MAYVHNEWWGYQHLSGTIQVKRAYYDYQLCVQEAILSPFVKKVVYKFKASSREEAIEYVKNQLVKDVKP